MTIFSKNLGGHAPLAPLTTPMVITPRFHLIADHAPGNCRAAIFYLVAWCGAELRVRKLHIQATVFTTLRISSLGW